MISEEIHRVFDSRPEVSNWILQIKNRRALPAVFYLQISAKLPYLGVVLLYGDELGVQHDLVLSQFRLGGTALLRSCRDSGSLSGFGVIILPLIQTAGAGGNIRRIGSAAAALPATGGNSLLYIAVIREQRLLRLAGAVDFVAIGVLFCFRVMPLRNGAGKDKGKQAKEETKPEPVAAVALPLSDRGGSKASDEGKNKTNQQLQKNECAVIHNNGTSLNLYFPK